MMPMDFDPIPNLHLGTSSWSAESWVGPFYPPGTPPGFLLAAKFPGEITHKKLLVDCERETDEFLSVRELLGEKLGPLLLQFRGLSAMLRG